MIMKMVNLINYMSLGALRPWPGPDSAASQIDMCSSVCGAGGEGGYVVLSRHKDDGDDAG